jgi:hypothetical protein
MNYFIQILWLLCWPALIYISYITVSWAVKHYEKELEE